MALFEKSEKLVPFPEIPDANSSFQTPTYLRVGDDIYLSYFIAPILKNRWDERDTRDTIKYIESAPHAVLHFSQAVYFLSEKHEDDTLKKHRLAKHGLKSLGLYEVVHSALTASMRKGEENSHIHQHHFPDDLRHFVFAMHGHMLEIISSGCTPHTRKGPLLSDLEGILRTSVLQPTAEEMA